MNMSIKAGIFGYGNLGRGVECAIRQNPDMVLAAFFTRRDPSALKTLTPEGPVYSVDQLLEKKDEIDVLFLCGGSVNQELLTAKEVEFPTCSARESKIRVRATARESIFRRTVSHRLSATIHHRQERTPLIFPRGTRGIEIGPSGG